MDPGRTPRTGSSSRVGVPEPFQERSKTPSIFQSILSSILGAIWLPKWLPKSFKINQKSFQNQILYEKCDFSKNSTSPRRDTHFGGSEVPKTLPKSTKNTTEADQKSNQKFDGFFNSFFNDFSFIWAPCGAHFGRQNRLKRDAAERVKGSFATTARRTRPGVPLGSQNGRQGPPQDPKMEPQGRQGPPQDPKMEPQGSPKSTKIVPFCHP